jgi:P pilus assembly chaperone PapD
MPLPLLCSHMLNDKSCLFRRLMMPAVLYSAVVLMLVNVTMVHAGVVIGGTRFIYGEQLRSITFSVRNTSETAYLLNTKVFSGGAWAGSDRPITAPAPFIATPPLFPLAGGRENSIRIVRTGGELPADRESLFTLSISSIPSGRGGPDSIQMAVRSSLKLFYRPAGLKGDPENAYKQLKWSRAGKHVIVENPTPYYVTLFQLKANGREFDNAGLVAPFSQRKESWCGETASCQLYWQTINDYGRVMPAVSLMVETGKANSVVEHK